nr:MAG TPA: hypothetical protein [Caudoviricetes sp.]
MLSYFHPPFFRFPYLSRMSRENRGNILYIFYYYEKFFCCSQL